MPAKKMEPLSLEAARDSLPLFAVGQEVKVERYVGILGANDPMTPGASNNFRPVACRIVAVRLAGEEREDWDEEKQAAVNELVYPEGWEYHVTHPTAGAWGWVSEAELLASGYTPAPSIYEEMRDALETAWILMDRGPRDPEEFPGYEKVRRVAQKLKLLKQLKDATQGVKT